MSELELERLVKCEPDRYDSPPSVFEVSRPGILLCRRCITLDRKVWAEEMEGGVRRLTLPTVNVCCTDQTKRPVRSDDRSAAYRD
jgi:hypothetical protein